MAITTPEARAQILDDLAEAIDQIAIAVACLGEAFELVSIQAGDRLEAELFRPAQKAYARGQQTHSRFAERHGVAKCSFELPPAGRPSQGAKAFIERAVVASGNAGRKISELQDSGLWIEFGDPDLRAGVSEVRELLGEVPGNARMFLRTLGR